MARIRVREATLDDAEECGRILSLAFKLEAERHGVPPVLDGMEWGADLTRHFVSDPDTYACLVECGGSVLGVSFLHEGDPVRRSGPMAIDPKVASVGPRLMNAMNERIGTAT